MGKLSEVIVVSELKDSEFINVVLIDGSLGKIRKSDLSEMIRLEMSVATPYSKGLMPSVPYVYGATPAISSLGYLDFKTNISNNLYRRYQTIEIDIIGIYSHNSPSMHHIHASVVVSDYRLKYMYYFNTNGNSNQSILSLILYKGTDDYIHLVVNTNTTLNISGGYLELYIANNYDLLQNQVLGLHKYNPKTNYQDGTNIEEIKCIIL